MTIDMYGWKDEVLASGRRLAVPIMTHPGAEIIGRSVREAVTDPEVQCSAVRAIREKYSPDASTMIMDLTVEAEAFGAAVIMPDHEIPTVTGRLVSDAHTAGELGIPGLDAGRIPQQLKAIRMTSRDTGDKPLFAECIGPFSLAGRLFGLSEIMTSLYLDPDPVKVLLDKCRSFLERYVNEIKNSGANGIIMAEPAAGLLSAELCDEFSSSHIRKIVESVQDRDFLFVLHNCGNTGHVTRSMASTGAGGLHFGNRVDMVEALCTIERTTVVMGNLDPVRIFKSPDPEIVSAETRGLLRKTAGHRNFIISSGCDVPPGTPPANIEAFFEAVSTFNSERSIAVS